MENCISVFVNQINFIWLQVFLFWFHHVLKFAMRFWNCLFILLILQCVFDFLFINFTYILFVSTCQGVAMDATRPTKSLKLAGNSSPRNRVRIKWAQSMLTKHRALRLFPLSTPMEVSGNYHQQRKHKLHLFLSIFFSSSSFSFSLFLHFVSY